jgi:hypothetical protein
MPRVRKIAKLPPEIRRFLEQALVEHAFGDIEHVTELLNAEVQRHGLSLRIGKSAVGEESLRLKRAQESIAASTRAMQLIADTAQDEADKRGEALNALVQEGLFEALILSREAEAEPDAGKRIALMNKAALASARLSISNVRQRKYRAEVEKAAKAAADSVVRLARQGGMSREMEAEIRRRILGIAQASHAATQADQAAEANNRAAAPAAAQAVPVATTRRRHGHAARAAA